MANIHPDQSLGWLRRLAPVLAARRWTLAASVLLALAGLLAQVAVPAVIRSAIDTSLTAGEAPLKPYIMALVALGLARGLLSGVSRYGLFRVGYGIDLDLRMLLYRHLTRLSFSFYDRTQSGQIISRANSDIRSVQMFLVFAPLSATTLVMFAVALIYMLSIDALLTLVAVLALPLVYVFGVRLRRDVFPLSWIVQSRLAQVASVVDENINGVRVVKSFAAEQAQLTSLAEAAQRVRWAQMRTAAARSRYAPLIENTPRIGTALVLAYGGWLVIEGRTTTGTLFAFTAYVVMLQGPFRTLGMLVMLGQRARASAGRIFEVLDEDPDIVDRPDAVRLTAVEGRIDFEDVRFAYRRPRPESADDGDPIEDAPSLPVLDGFSLHVEPGETVALVGRTGAGKSTVARLLARFYDVDEGAIRVDGHDVRAVTQQSLRDHLGLVLDEPFLFSTSIHDNIAYGRPGASRSEVYGAARAAQADEFIRALPRGYDTVVGERGYTLSGGQRQRVAVARALLIDSPILVLDDATSAIDVHVEVRLHDALAARLGSRTTLIIAQRLSTIALADRVVLIDGGRVIAEGTHKHLLVTEPRYVEVLAQGGEPVIDPSPPVGSEADGALSARGGLAS